MSIIEKAVEQQGDAEWGESVPSEKGTSTNGVVKASSNLEHLESGALLSRKELLEKHVISFAPENRAVRDSFRQLRQNILNVELERQRRSAVILVAPAAFGESSRFVATNLATAIAFRNNCSSLLIDTDLESPPKNADDGEELGLLNYLADPNVSVKDILRPFGVPRLNQIPLGGDGAETNEYLGSTRMSDLIDDVADRFADRYVILNGPSSAADLAILSQYCDAALLVVPCGVVPESRVWRSIDAIGPDKLLGLVMDNIPPWQQIASA
jgi:Mrp family chromosome partitioning ATPase